MITKGKLAFHKLVKDLVGTNAVLACVPAVISFFPLTLIFEPLAEHFTPPDNIENSRRAKVIKTGILEISPRAFPKGDAKTEEEWVVKVQKQMDYSIEQVQRAIGPRMRMYGRQVYVFTCRFFLTLKR